MTNQAEGDDFDIAKAVFDKLKDVPLERRRRIFGWVAESLGVTLAGVFPHLQPAPESPRSPLSLPPAVSPPQTGTDIKTFVVTKAPKSDVQFATTVAYYYRFEAPAAQKRQLVDGEVVQEAARLVGRTRLSNPGKTLNNAKALGYLDSSAPGEFSINSVGENLVAMTLPGSSDVGNSRARRSSSKVKARGKGGRKR